MPVAELLGGRSVRGISRVREEVTMMTAKKKILVIDDDPEICEALEEILAEYDYDVFSAQDTVTGEHLMEERRPDLLILDIMMATMHEGLDFAARLKAKEGAWGIPILIVSARPPVEKGYARSIDQDLDWIATDIFMEKPVDPEDLIRNVKILLHEPVDTELESAAS
jgi:DNA-binding response OmpR family regulator